jgi:hypothetical protein
MNGTDEKMGVTTHLLYSQPHIFGSCQHHRLEPGTKKFKKEDSWFSVEVNNASEKFLAGVTGTERRIPK